MLLLSLKPPNAGKLCLLPNRRARLYSTPQEVTLLAARGGRRGRRRGGGCRWCWGYIPHVQPLLPSIALTTINLYPIALSFYRTKILAFKSHSPYPVAPCLIASRSYNVRGILISLVEMIAEMNLLEYVCPMFHDGLPTVNRPCIIHQNRVLRVEWGQGGGIAVVERLVSFLTERFKLLLYLRIGSVFLLGKGWHNKADCQSYKGE